MSYGTCSPARPAALVAHLERSMRVSQQLLWRWLHNGYLLVMSAQKEISERVLPMSRCLVQQRLGTNKTYICQIINCMVPAMQRCTRR